MTTETYHPDLNYWKSHPITKNYYGPVFECTNLDTQFVEDVLACDENYYKFGLHGLMSSTDPRARRYFCGVLQRSYTMYQCAAKTLDPRFWGNYEDQIDNDKHKNELFIVVGRITDLYKEWNPKLFEVAGLADSNVRFLKDNCNHPTLMHIEDSSWNILANDSWLLGGVNSNANFRIASPICIKNLWSDGRMTVTARELIGLLSFGYELEGPKDRNGDSFTITDDIAKGGKKHHLRAYAYATCVDKQKAIGATLIDYQKRVQYYLRQGEAEIKKLFKELPKNVAYDDNALQCK